MEEAEASSSASAPADGAAETPVVQITVLHKFISSRGLHTRAPAKQQSLSPGKLLASRRSVPAPPDPPAPAPWHSYSKRQHGERVSRLREAMRIPEPDYAECLDAYVRRKKAQRLLDLHADADGVSAEYAAATRAMFFEREVVDRPVCDREQNRRQYEQAMRALAAEELALSCSQ